MINGTKIICFSGSTRFTKNMLDLAWEFNKQGIITIGWDYHPDGFDKDWNELNHGYADDLGIREQLDKNHLIKIDLSDEVYIINLGGYIGDGTRREIKYALEHNKPVRYFENKCPRCNSTVIFLASNPKYKHRCHICEYKWRDERNGG